MATKTTEQKKRDEDNKSTDAQESKTDAAAAASGKEAGAVVRGDSGLTDEYKKEDSKDDKKAKKDEGKDAAIVDAKSDEVKGAVAGTVRAGRENVPFVFLTPDMLGSKVRTSDADDEKVRSWSVQSTEDDDETPVTLVPEQAEPGQTFTVGELPNVDVMKAAGIDPAQLLSGLPVRLEDPDTQVHPAAGSLG